MRHFAADSAGSKRQPRAHKAQNFVIYQLYTDVYGAEKRQKAAENSKNRSARLPRQTRKGGGKL